MDNMNTGTVMQWIFGKLAPYKPKVALALSALLVGAASWLMLGQGVKIVVDEGFVSNDPDTLNQAIFVVLAITLTGSVAAYLRFYWMVWLGERVSADIRKEVYAHLLTLSPEFFSEIKTGEVISRFTSDTTVLQSIIGVGLSMALRSAVSFIGSLILMFITSPLLTLYVMLAVPILILPVRLLSARVRKFARHSQDKVADMGAYVDESLHEIHTVQSYTHEHRDRSNFEQRIESVMGAASQRIHARALMTAIIMAVSLSAIAIVFWLGAREVMNGGVSAGELAAFMFYAMLAGGSLAAISEVIGEVQKAAGASERLLELLNTQPMINAPTTVSPLPERIEGRLTLNALNFAYPSDPRLTVLSEINLSIQAGERVALVGPSGAGKSSLFQVLLRFYDWDTGSILLDDIETTALDPKTLRQQFALVPQESVIFAMSALDNIRYGRPEASTEEVIAAAKAAKAHEFIDALPDAYQTDLGERGVRLSGGQKQRIAIARAILADRPILLLDEATSALDASSELQVKLALDELMKNKTTLIIAHRLSTVVNADRIIVLDKGRIVASGKHHELVKHNELYKEFAELQLVG